MYRINQNTKIAILSDNKKKEWPLGDYIHIIFCQILSLKVNYTLTDTFKIIKSRFH